ncbi:MAG: ATP-binding protein [Usitatibacter sp.]
MYPRLARLRLEAALDDTPVVLLNGARQTGKTTLARQVAEDRGGRYVTLDDSTALAAATADAGAFVDGLGKFAVIDEVQRAPALFPALKIAVDRDRSPGRFLLTGSANVLTLPRISDSLAGRMEIIPILPLAQVEIAGATRNPIDLLFSLQPLALGKPVGEQPLDHRITRGGFPEAVERTDAARRDAWFSSYVSAILQRDIRDLANIEGLTAMPRLLQLLAARSAGLLNYSDIARSMAMPQSTLKRYLALFESVFLTRMLPAWSTNRGSRLIKSPKVHLVDSGLAAHLLGLDAAGLAAHPHLSGQLLESFVAGEVAKLAAASSRRLSLHHFRTLTNREVDIVLESGDGRVIGIEVKSASKVEARDFAGLRSLAEEAGKHFAYGVVLHTGETVASFGPTLQAAPVSLLWRARAES